MAFGTNAAAGSGAMPSPLAGVLVRQHVVLRERLAACLRTPGEVDVDGFDEFRRALLRHVRDEEGIIIPWLARVMGADPQWRAGLRKDHVGIAALCVPLPEREWVENLRDLLDEHYRTEEAPGGFVDLCDRYLGAQSTELLAAMAVAPALELPAFRTGPTVKARLDQVLLAIGAVDAPKRSKP